MGKALVVGGVVVVIAVLVFIGVIWFRRQQAKETAAAKGWALKGDLSRAQEQQLISLLDESNRIMGRISGPVYDLSGDVTLLSAADRRLIEGWIGNYRNQRKDAR